MNTTIKFKAGSGHLLAARYHHLEQWTKIYLKKKIHVLYA